MNARLHTQLMAGRNYIAGAEVERILRARKEEEER